MKHFEKILTALMAVVLAFTGTGAAYAGSAERDSVPDRILSSLHEESIEIHNDDQGGKNTSDLPQPSVDVKDLPEKYDLRDVDGKCYVPEVRDQFPFSTCWSFGAIAAAEISVMSALGYDYNQPVQEEGENINLHMDFSEKHLAWFLFDYIREDSERYASQTGEGYHLLLPDDADAETVTTAVYGSGSRYTYANGLYSAGIGPVPEVLAPYRDTRPEGFLPTGTIYTAEFAEDGKIIPDSITAHCVDKHMTDEEFNSAMKELINQGYELMDGSVAVEFYMIHSSTNPPSEENIQKLYLDIEKKAGGKSRVVSGTLKGTEDWTMDESLRYFSLFDLVDGNILPSPATTDGTGKYIYNPVATDAIKSEIVKGRGVAVAFQADQAMPGQEIAEDSCLNFLDDNFQPTDDPEKEAVWAHYSYDKSYDPEDPGSVNRLLTANHAVCIVGYDDHFPKEAFKDPKGMLQGDGAWLVRNSWGSKDNSNVLARKDWGNNGSGYFWLSYYDQSLTMPESFVFDTDPEGTAFMEKDLSMYDHMTAEYYRASDFDDEVLMANVFTAESTCTIRFIGLETLQADSDVEYRVYLLHDDAAVPTDGELVADAKLHFNYSGYHRVDLGKNFPFIKGSRYSVVAKVTNHGHDQLYTSRSVNKAGHDWYEEYFKKNSAEEQASMGAFYAESVVNRGESFIGYQTGAGMEWADYADVRDKLMKMDRDLNNSGFAYDNFPIRSYPQTESFILLNAADTSRTYHEGDVIEGVISLENNTEKSFDDISFEVTVSLGDLGENNADGKFTGLQAGEIRNIPYQYTVTAEDVKAGKITSLAKFKINGKVVNYDPIFKDSYVYSVTVE